MYQFGHMNWAARVQLKKQTYRGKGSSKTRETGWSAQDLADEAERKPGACDHVESPQPPSVIYGVSPSEAVAQATAWGEQATEGGKKRRTKLRSTSPVMASGVISMPRSAEDVWPAYRDAAVEALKERYGERLLSVVEHLDEAHPHIHFYLVPRPGESFGAVHEGYLARQAERAKGPGAKVKTAYKAAMEAWQDWLYERVSRHFGLARMGPGRERLSREEYMRQQAIARALAEQAAAERIRREAEKDHQAVIAIQSEARSGLAAIEQQQADLAGELRDLRRERRELERKKEALTIEQQQRVAELNALEEKLKAERAGIKRAFAEARVEGRKKGLEEAAAVSVGKKVGLAIATLKEQAGIETSRERKTRERLEREAAEKERLEREAADLRQRERSLKASVEALKTALAREQEDKQSIRRDWGIDASDQARRIRELEQQIEDLARKRSPAPEHRAQRLR